LTGWTIVNVQPPAAGCCTVEWTSSCVNTIATAVTAAAANTILKLAAGDYCNSNYISSKTRSTRAHYQNKWLVEMTHKTNLTITSTDTTKRPNILVDGAGAFRVVNG
jgi:hypothetical protein